MIVSASYRTDIPGFYARWFERRYASGYCLAIDPFGGAVRWVPLRRPHVHGFVFWTRNIAPFMGALRRVFLDGFPFTVQYTITDYPKALEERVSPAERAIHLCHEIADLYGPEALVWRYDPIVITSQTGYDYHRQNFARLCDRLRGTTNEAVVSFASMYRKTRLNLDRAARVHGFTVEDPPIEEKRAFLYELTQIAAERDVALTVCAQRELLGMGLRDASCVDAERLSRMAGRELEIPRRAHRPSCGCWQSVDIGAYDTCASGCVYCYAVRNRATAEQRLRDHRPEDLLLWRPPRLRGLSNLDLLELATGREERATGQMVLFEYE